MTAEQSELDLSESDPPCISDGTGSVCDLARLFDAASQGREVVRSDGDHFVRRRVKQSGAEVLLDSFGDSGTCCLFVRKANPAGTRHEIGLPGSYRAVRCRAGGWLLISSVNDCTYWVPAWPTIRETDSDGHMSSEADAEIYDVAVAETRSICTMGSEKEGTLDIVLWKIPPEDQVVRDFLENPGQPSTPFFLWGSHTSYRAVADVFRHLVHGRVYEDRYRWPRYVRMHSENDAHALYVVLTGLYRNTGVALYDQLRWQVVFSVIERQGEDGGWRHGEWTDSMEAHFRLHCSAMHMLMDFVQEFPDKAAGTALRCAAEFLGTKYDQTEFGAWFYHDELETSTERMAASPFRWVKSRAFGKSESNMLVLNTQLDASVALDRYQELTGDERCAQTVASAMRCTRAVLGSRSATWLYRPLCFILALTVLPNKRAAALPFPIRALKRVGWKYLVHRLPAIKGRFPRLVMPDGYIARDLTLAGLSDPYLSINAMDLARYIRRAPDPEIRRILADAIQFARQTEITAHWAEQPAKRYALGFWQEVFYHLCLMDPGAEFRRGLAAAVCEAAKAGVGMAPSLLGANAEVVAPLEQVANWKGTESGLTMVNLSRKGVEEILLVNAAVDTVQLRSSSESQDLLSGEVSRSPDVRQSADKLSVPAAAWISVRR